MLADKVCLCLVWLVAVFGAVLFGGSDKDRPPMCLAYVMRAQVSRHAHDMCSTGGESLQ